ncbi:hypothetical protein DFH06DRAFT_1338844 [Mycena polygramma]|nr:hypothetical protein DFH06DRAFT_1338844 [Mycena polygramma]
MTLRVLFGEAEKPRTRKPSQRVMEEEEELTQALAEAAEDEVPDDGAIEIDSDDEYAGRRAAEGLILHKAFAAAKPCNKALWANTGAVASRST